MHLPGDNELIIILFFSLQIEDTDWEYQIPGMAGHTMTRVDDIRIWLVGGFSTENYFTDAVYQYDTSSNEWTELQLTGAQPTGTA